MLSHEVSLRGFIESRQRDDLIEQAHWSDGINPNGPWCFNHGGSPLRSLRIASKVKVLPRNRRMVGRYVRTMRSEFRFVANSSARPPAILIGYLAMSSCIPPTASGKGNGLANVTWTSPVNGEINVTGSVWQGVDLDNRGSDWGLFLNGRVLTGGRLAVNNQISRANPYLVAIGTNGPTALQHLPVSVGDVLSLQFRKSSGFGVWAGVRMTITADLKPKLQIRCSQVELSWNTLANVNFQVQYRSALTTNKWVPLHTLRGNGGILCTNSAIPLGEPQRFEK